MGKQKQKSDLNASEFIFLKKGILSTHWTVMIVLEDTFIALATMVSSLNYSFNFD